MYKTITNRRQAKLLRTILEKGDQTKTEEIKPLIDKIKNGAKNIKNSKDEGVKTRLKMN